MKKIFLFLALAFVVLQLNAQTITTEDTQASLEISKNIIRLIGSLAKDFEANKGDLITKTDDGTNVYAVKDITGMQTDDQFIMVKSNGNAFYGATYKGDVKKTVSSFTAFTGGVIAVTDADGTFTVSQDKEKSTGSTLVYNMFVKGVKVANYTLALDGDDKNGMLIIGFL